MSIRKAYSKWATSYDLDRNLTRDLDQEVTRATLGQQQYNTIIELGCGTGKNTPLFAQIGQRVFATDFSEGMIAQAKAKLHLSNVIFTVADLTQAWPYANHCADLIVCNLILEHIADLGFIFTEGHRVLADGGRFYISELHPFKQYTGKKATFQRGDQQTEIPAFVHHISAFLEAAEHPGFTLKGLREWWHETDEPTLPRLVTFMFHK